MTQGTAQPPSTHVLDQVQAMLDQGRPKDALELVLRARQRSQAVENARAVCLMRLGKAEEAVSSLRAILFPHGSITMDSGVPVVFQSNFATALLLTGNMVAARDMLAGASDHKHPSVAKVREAVRKWKRGLGLLRRALLWLGVSPGKPVTFDYPPGELWRPPSTGTRETA